MRAASLLLLLFVSPVLLAGDEVDYSAPYIVVEDGKLVTKYPAQEHAGQSTDVASAPAAELPQTREPFGTSAAEPWLFTGAVLAVLLTGLAVTMRRQV